MEPRLSSLQLLRILDAIRHMRIVEADDLRRLGLKYAFLGSGMSRRAYHLVGTPWVVKLLSPSGDVGESLREVAAVQTIHKSYPMLRRYMPSILHHDPDTGMILMVRYQHVHDKPEYVKQSLREAMERAFRAQFQDTCMHVGDLHFGNIGLDFAGRPKVLDAGDFWLR